MPFPPPGDLPNPGIKPGSPALRADRATREALKLSVLQLKKKERRRLVTPAGCGELPEESPRAEHIRGTTWVIPFRGAWFGKV